MKGNPVRMRSVMGEVSGHNKDAVVRARGMGLKAVEIMVRRDGEDGCLVEVKNFLHRLFSTGDS